MNKEGNMINVKYMIIGLLVLNILVLLYSNFQLIGDTNIATGVGTNTNTIQQTSLNGPDVIPKGIPEIYGKELEVSYDDVSANNPNKADATIGILGDLDVKLTLDEKQKERYINILYKLENGISCEYCCGARSIIFENGEAACGCAHSYAMRGLAKYLLINHRDEYTDTEILEEVGKWKTLFFPGQVTQKAAILKSQGIETNYVNIASNKYRGIEKGASAGSGMVGGC
ncbi:MAG TPA: hypothetical protein VJI69_01190 [Bacteroidia bacterium]|nr:hypothetical protein [Bacteroidia bacterium]